MENKKLGLGSLVDGKLSVGNGKVYVLENCDCGIDYQLGSGDLKFLFRAKVPFARGDYKGGPGKAWLYFDISKELYNSLAGFFCMPSYEISSGL